MPGQFLTTAERERWERFPRDLSAEAQTLRALLRWLTARALEHDRPSLLLQLACEKLRQDKVLRPGLSRLERLVITARNQARHETARHLAPLLTDLRRVQLDALLSPDVALGRTRLAWLQHGAVTASPSTILATLDKLVWLHALGVEGWNLTGLTPNRRKFLAGIARRSTNQALQRMPTERRYPNLGRVPAPVADGGHRRGD